MRTKCFTISAHQSQIVHRLNQTCLKVLRVCFAIACNMSYPRHYTTVVVDFSSLTRQPNPANIHQFITRDLKVKPDTLRCLQINTRGIVLLEFADPVVAAYTTSRNLQHSIGGNKIPIYLDDNTTEVRILDLPHGIDNLLIENAMSLYGEVLTINNERWKNFFPGLPNGVRVLRMKLKQPVPKLITVQNLTATVIHKGQKAIGRLSKNKKHKGTKCAEKSKATTEKDNNLDPTQPTEPPYTEPENRAEPENDSKTENITNCEIATDDDDFEIVLSKDDRRKLKRQHSKEKDQEAKQKRTPMQLEEFYYKRWTDLQQRMKQTKDPELQKDLQRREEIFFNKWQVYYDKCEDIKRNKFFESTNDM